MKSAFSTIRSRPHRPLAAWLAAALLTAAAPHANAQSRVWDVPQDPNTTWRGPIYVPGELLVKFKPGVGPDRAADAIHRRGATSRGRITSDGLTWVKLPPGSQVADVIDGWNALPEVEYAAPNLYAAACSVPNDSVLFKGDIAWYLRVIGAYDAWDVVTGDPDVVVAIIDTGVACEDFPIPDYERAGITAGVTMYRRSPDLMGPILPGYDFVNSDEHPNDDNGHGTHVATIAAGTADNVAGGAGVAHGVSILPVKVLDHGATGSMAPIVQGIRFAADQGAHVANLSLGFPPLYTLLSVDSTRNEIVHAFKPLRDAVLYAQRRGTILVAAAGNFRDSVLSYPAGYPGVISVGATGFDNLRAPYSSYGSGLKFMAPGGDFTELNGDHVQDLIPALSIKPWRNDPFPGSEGSLANPDSFNVFYLRGTSAACPQVTGAVALLLSQGHTNQGVIEQLLRSTAIHPLGNRTARDPEYGFGLIQIDKAVQARFAGTARERLPNTETAAARLKLRTANPSPGGATLALRITRPGTVRVRVFDVRGALIRTVEQATAPAGERLFTWDGMDARGAPVPSGIYYLRAESPDGSATRRIAILR